MGLEYEVWLIPNNGNGIWWLQAAFAKLAHAEEYALGHHSRWNWADMVYRITRNDKQLGETTRNPDKAGPRYILKR